jgi:hypothetical protein
VARSKGKPANRENLATVLKLKTEGKTQAEVRRALGLSKSKVSRYRIQMCEHDTAGLHRGRREIEQLPPNSSITAVAGNEGAYAPAPNDQSGNVRIVVQVRLSHDCSWTNPPFFLSTAADSLCAPCAKLMRFGGSGRMERSRWW